MKHLVLKLDDIGRDSSRPVIDVVLWAMQAKMPISIGTIGSDLKSLPRELIELIQTASRSGLLELWNHGFRHIRYDEASEANALVDLAEGHKAVIDTFGIVPDGFGYPFNRFTEESVSSVRTQYPEYFIYESDFKSFKLISPEFNAYADGQPKASYFLERLGSGNGTSNIILQAHPPRWSKAGFEEFKRCVIELVENRGYVCLKGRDALESASEAFRAPMASTSVAKVVRSVECLSATWAETADQYIPTLSNFKDYFLARFNSDTQKNWHQVLAELSPFKPKKVLDIGCGLGNWSLPFWMSGEADTLVLNDVHPTIVDALKDGISHLARKDGVSVVGTNLLAGADTPKQTFDFLVSANTFNYLDPVDLFKFAQESVVPGGRMLLMLQTPAFNRLRYRRAYELADRATGVEALESDFAMFVRAEFGVFPTSVRHAYPLVEVERLATMFDFNLISKFSPYGEHKEDGESVYECLLFKKTANMRDAISNRPEWLETCLSTVGSNFGSKAFNAAGISIDHSTTYFGYRGNWVIREDLSNKDAETIRIIKDAIQGIRQGTAVDMPLLNSIGQDGSPASNFARRVLGFAEKLS